MAPREAPLLNRSASSQCDSSHLVHARGTDLGVEKQFQARLGLRLKVLFQGRLRPLAVVTCALHPAFTLQEPEVQPRLGLMKGTGSWLCRDVTGEHSGSFCPTTHSSLVGAGYLWGASHSPTLREVFLQYRAAVLHSAHGTFLNQSLGEGLRAELLGQTQGCSDTQQLRWNHYNPNQKPVQTQFHATCAQEGVGGTVRTGHA